MRIPRVVIKSRAQPTADYWIYRVRRNIFDHPWRSLAVIFAVVVGVSIAITIIAASNRIQDSINTKLNANAPGQAGKLQQVGINMNDIQAVLTTTRGILSKFAIGSTAALVGLVT